MNSQFWDFAAASAVVSTPNQNGPFPANVSSYFRRPSKVVKSSSRNSSPRTTGRRRMTTSGQFPARTRSVIDYERASMPQLSQYQAAPNRPISWHPNTMQDMTYLQIPQQYASESVMASPYTTVEMNGLVTPLSFPMMDEPQIQELITPLEGLSADDAATAYSQGQDFSMEAWLNQQQMKNLGDFHASMYPDMGHSGWYHVNHYELPANITTAPASPSYLPMPDFGAPLPDVAHEAEPEKEELVGMGLYDSPAEVQSSSLLFGNGFGSSARKTLKLEDAFEPTQSSDDEDDEEDDEDEDAPGEPDDTFSVQPTAEDITGSAKNGLMHTAFPGNDFATMQQWQMAQGGYAGWI